MRSMDSVPTHVLFPKKEKAYALIAQQDVPFRYATVGITYPDPDYHIDRSSHHSTNVFEIVLEGEGEILLDGVWKRVTAGQMYILRAGEEHHYRATREDPWKKMWINYGAQYIGALLDAYGIQSCICPGEEALQYFELAFETAKNGGAHAEAGRTVAECVHKMISIAASRRTSNTASDECRIREELSAALYRKLDLDELCQKLHISKSNVIRIFKKHYGTTPYEYLLSSKIEAAKVLLSTTRLTVKEIADRLCISDEHYFSTLFSRRVGLSPRAFRQKSLKG